MAEPKKKNIEEHNKRVADDQGRCQKKFFPTFAQASARAQRQCLSKPDEKTIEKRRSAAEEALAAEPEGARAANDAMLPAAQRTDLARMTEAFCRHGSWTSCAQCGLLRHKPFQAMDISREPPAEIKKCANCLSKSPQYVPQPEDVPEPLRGLTPSIVKALRPLDVDAGTYKRASQGYREHTSMMRFAWAEDSVQEKIAELKGRKHRKKARKAYRYLIEAEGSAYKDFVSKHEEYLVKHPDASEQKRKRPWRFIEEPGLECAVWPHLYWKRSMCESVERFTDERRLARTGRKRARYWRRAEDADAAQNADTESDCDEDDRASAEAEDLDGDIVEFNDDELEGGRHSAKASFMAKVLSPLLGYGTDYELLQYVFDLNMWSTLGGKKNSQKGIPLRVT